MSLLSYNELCGLIEQGVITADINNVNSASIDLTLDDVIRIEYLNEFDPFDIDLANKESISTKAVQLTEDGYLINPGQFILASSVEMFNLPNNISGEYKLKSTMARNGLEHLNAGWCLTGDTLIPLLDGTTVPISDLVDTTPWVYSIDSDGEVVAGKASKVWLTKYVSKLVEITLDNGETFRCTPEHKIMLRNGDYCEAESLDEGIALMPLNRRIDDEGYEWVYCPSTVKKSNWQNFKGKWRKTQHCVDNSIYGKQEIIDHVTHHIDENRRNNVPDNIVRMSANDHIALHNRERNGTIEQRKICSETMRNTNIESWKDSDYREKMTQRNKRNAAFTNNKRWGTEIPAEYLNHKVKSVKLLYLSEPVAVYDMTVDKYHNFALNSGVVVHNCDAGWTGSKLTLELLNVTQQHFLKIRPGMKIGQIVFFKHEPVPADKSYATRGQYNNQKAVTAAKTLI